MIFEVLTRPLRVGWCVRQESTEDFRQAVRLTHTLWGGRFNPIIPIGEAHQAKALIDLFSVDVLYPIAREAAVQEFAQSFAHLPWPFFRDAIHWKDERGRHRPLLLDVSHPLYLLRPQLHEMTERVLPLTDLGDTLLDSLIATYGAFPLDEFGREYEAGFQTVLGAVPIQVSPAAPVAPILAEAVTPNVVSSFALQADRVGLWEAPGLFVGESANLGDLVPFWNLRAAGVDLLFYDPAQRDRLDPLAELHLQRIEANFDRRNDWDRHISVWSCHLPAEKLAVLGDLPMMQHRVDDVTWNGLNITPPTQSIGRAQVLGVESQTTGRLSVSMQMPARPWLQKSNRSVDQHAVFSFSPYLHNKDDVATFEPFNLPILNEWYAREAGVIWNTVRLGRHGLGVIDRVNSQQQSLYAIPPRDIIQHALRAHGIQSEPSPPGLIAQRLIRQMGGIQGCRVFKICGVRELIERHTPLSSFTRSAAIQVIGDVRDGTPHFHDYEDLYIERRDRGKLTPQAAFTYLLSKGVFRAGLELKCPHCSLDFWSGLDDLRSVIRCEYCGQEFAVAPLLKDRDWRYRRSGLFGRADHQQGAIPVVLTLQQLDTSFHYDRSCFTASMAVSASAAGVPACEVDFVFMAQAVDGSLHIALGECKSRQEIAEEDVKNLTLLVDALHKPGIESFVVFSKTTAFSPEEVARCKKGQTKYRTRIVLLGPRELEPYFIYQGIAVDGVVSPLHAGTLPDLATATEKLYFAGQEA